MPITSVIPAQATVSELKVNKVRNFEIIIIIVIIIIIIDCSLIAHPIQNKVEMQESEGSKFYSVCI